MSSATSHPLDTIDTSARIIPFRVARFDQSDLEQSVRGGQHFLIHRTPHLARDDRHPPTPSPRVDDPAIIPRLGRRATSPSAGRARVATDRKEIYQSDAGNPVLIRQLPDREVELFARSTSAAESRARVADRFSVAVSVACRGAAVTDRRRIGNDSTVR